VAERNMAWKENREKKVEAMKQQLAGGYREEAEA
jgi:hypothetical protein